MRKSKGSDKAKVHVEDYLKHDGVASCIAISMIIILRIKGCCRL